MTSAWILWESLGFMRPGCMWKANRSPAWLRILTEPKTEGESECLKSRRAHTPIAYQLSELISISLRARNKTRHFQKFLWKHGAAWFSFKIFIFFWRGGWNRNKAWTNMNCHNNASMIYYFSESERSFIYMMSTRMAK